MGTTRFPQAILSADGRRLASLAGSTVDIVDYRSGHVQALHLPGPAHSVAFAPDGALLVVACGSRISLYEVSGRDARRRWTVETAGPVTGLALSSSTVAALHPDGAALWSTAEPVEKRVATPAPRRLALDARGRLLVTSYRDGRLFAQLYAGADYTVAWKSHTLPFEPAAIHLTANGALVAHNRRRLARISPNGTVALLDQFDQLETCAFSPNGRWLAWFWGRGPSTICRLRLADLDEGTFVAAVDHFGIGHFPAAAVDDAGVAVLAYGHSGNHIRTLHLTRAGAEPALSVRVHH